MTITETPATPAAQEPRRTHRGLRIAGAVLGGAALLGGGLTLGARASSPPPPRPAVTAPASPAVTVPAPIPSTASGVLAADGYAVMKSADNGAGLGADARQYVAGMAMGTNSAGQVEAVIMFRPEGVAYMPLLGQELQRQAPGLTVTTDGQIMRVTGPMSAFGSGGRSAL